MITALLLATAAVAPQAAPIVSPPATSPADAVRRSKALQIVKLLCPESTVIEESGDDYVANARQLLVARGKLDDLEARYPGIVEAMLRASVPTMNAQMRRRLSVLWVRLTDIYLARLAGPELDQTLAFYTSPTGKKMIASMDARMKPKAMTNDMIRNDDLSISLGSLQSDLKDALPGVISDMGPADKSALLAFMRTSAFPKLAAIVVPVQQTTLRWAQESSPEDDQQIQTVMADAMKAYMKARDARSVPAT